MPDHPHCHSTALLFSLYTRRDIDSDDSYARPLIHACAQPIVWFVYESCAHDTEQKDGKQFYFVKKTFYFFFYFFFYFSIF